MYNGVGLTTARGSGTSGYVQKNLSYLAPGAKPKNMDYGKILQQLKVPSLPSINFILQENPLPPPRPPNKDLMEHEQKRKIEAQLFKLEKELKTAGKLSESEIKEAVKKAREHMLEKLKQTPTLIDTKEAN